MYRDAENRVKDSFQAFLVQGANFTKNEEYPIIKRAELLQNKLS